MSCLAGFYFSASTDSCRLCPANSESTVEGPTLVCPCREGFYRASEEEDLPCTSMLFVVVLGGLGIYLVVMKSVHAWCKG